jgi:hypothetical protein
MRRLLFALATVLVSASAAFAQPTMTSSILMPNPGVPVTLTVTGTAGQSFAVIGSITWAGFSYAGVDLAVGTDVSILGTGVLNGSGQGTVSFTPPFPARDRYYVQAVTSDNGFATITPSSRLTLLNNQEARLNMPIGGLIRADGSTLFLSPGITVSHNSHHTSMPWASTKRLAPVNTVGVLSGSRRLGSWKSMGRLP